ncbi:hypothetical protein EYF80_018419 [Liparis tanakae]|uniref:Uncharacterized protein n=1 Tax=Liparis tanakae TaxID=230148 RepID=A0A4Z2I0K7_9TELE|nr:hypothetical protein EYF80_018419 [Liparis tanakae]
MFAEGQSLSPVWAEPRRVGCPHSAWHRGLDCLLKPMEPGCIAGAPLRNGSGEELGNVTLRERIVSPTREDENKELPRGLVHNTSVVRVHFISRMPCPNHRSRRLILRPPEAPQAVPRRQERGNKETPPSLPPRAEGKQQSAKVYSRAPDLSAVSEALSLAGLVKTDKPLYVTNSND